MLSRFSLRATLIVGVLVAGSVVALVTGVGSASAVRRLTIASTLERHEALASRIAAEYEQVLTLHLQAVQTVAALAAGQPRLDTAALSSMLARTRESYPALKDIGVADQHGRLVLAEPATDRGDGTTGRDVSDRGWWKEMLLARRPLVDKSVVVGGGDRTGPSVSVNAPIIDTHGQFRGAITGTLDLTHLQPSARRFQPGLTGQASVASAQGVLVAHPDAAQVGRDLSRLAAWALMTDDSGHIAAYLDQDGSERLAGFATVRLTGWKVWVSQERSEIEGQVTQAFAGVLPWVLVALGGLTAAAIVLALVVSRPIRAVEATATAIAEGDLGGRAPERGPREITGLARSFNRMAAALRARLTAEQDSKAALERALRDYGALAARVAGGDLSARVTPAVEAELRELGWNLNRMATELERQVETQRRATASEAAARAESERRRRQAEAANQRVGQILDSITDGFMTLDREWRVVYANRRSEETMGRRRRSQDGIIGKVLWEEFPDLVGSVVQREFQRASRDEVTVQFEFFYAPLGAWFEVRGYPSPEGLSVYFQDVTDRKRGEESVRESEERLRMAVEAGRMGTWEWRIDTGTFTFDAVQREIHPDDRERVVQALVTAVEQRQDLRVEYRIVRADGAVRWVEGRGRLVGERQEQPERVVGLCMDITERKQTEEERGALLASEQRARAEAESVSHAKDEFLAVLSHELRTPLNAVLGWSRMLRFGSLDRATVERAIETIERNAQLQTQLVDDLIDVSRMVSGKLRIDRRRVDLGSVLVAALEAVRVTAEAKGVQLERTVEAPADVSGDAARLQQVFWNLLSNAIKFTPAGGRVQMSLLRREGGAEIRITDTGSGIAPAVLPHIFERFRQGEGGTTREYGGLGLGLTIVRHLVELHGGTVRAETAGEGWGATFVVELPMMAGREPSRETRLLQGIDVLLVDDDADGRELLATGLGRAGASVRAVPSVAQALAQLDHRVPDVLVSDLAMPDEDGYALIRHVRSFSERGHRVPAVAVSAYARDEDRRRALDAGYDLHLAKPIDPAELAQQIVKLVGVSSDSARAPATDAA